MHRLRPSLSPDGLSPSPSPSPQGSSPSPSPYKSSKSLKIWTRVRLEYTVGLEYYITACRMPRVNWNMRDVIEPHLTQV